MPLADLLSELGYTGSEFFRQDVEDSDIAMVHLLRDAQQRARVKGAYFIRTNRGCSEIPRERPAVYVAEASTVGEARDIHRLLWNQGTTPFLLISLPDQVRVYTPFAFEQENDKTGQVIEPLDSSMGLREITNRLQFLRAASIDSGNIWKSHGAFLQKDKRVDHVLLRTLRSISRILVRDHHLDSKIAHALVGRFVYLYYLRERVILSDAWLASKDIASDSVFSSKVRLSAFRRLTEAVDNRFNGHIFPIDWHSSSAPSEDAVKAVGRAFAGENIDPDELPLVWSFDFSFIPIELLSAIYEQFLHDEGKGSKEGAFYTSEPVADYLLAEVESVRQLEPGMKVLDPCCGSGIFLVLAFRRLVEMEMRRRKTNRLLLTELRQILTSSIFGVERNSEACLVTQFSLILALLSYIDPPELHRYTNFKFPTLHDEQIFQTDFFFAGSAFWNRLQKYDWIVGNPPWVELKQKDNPERPAISWIQQSRKTYPVSRYRVSEAFTWRAKECLAETGVIGFVTPATTLTNDHSAEYRKAFFAKNFVHRITNFSNLAYLLFDSAQEPAACLIYSNGNGEKQKPDIIHFGPLVVNQTATVPDESRRRRVPWVITISESEIQTIPIEEALLGDGRTWKRALWGNPRDRRALERLCHILPTTLQNIVSRRSGWALNLGLQLRKDVGTEEAPNQTVTEIKRKQNTGAQKYENWFSKLRVVNPERPIRSSTRLTLPEQWLVKNEWGTLIRKRGGTEGLNIVSAPHLFLWNEFAPFSDQDFIFRHPDIGLSAPPEDADWLRAISVIWSSSITRYCLFLDLSAGWGISRSTIDLGDVRRMPMPDFDDGIIKNLANLHAELAAEENNIGDRADWQQRLDEGVASALSIPAQIMLLAREFSEYRLPLVKGKAPHSVTKTPDLVQLRQYASRLKSELDGFLERKSRRHNVTVLRSQQAIVATIEITDSSKSSRVIVKDADSAERHSMHDILDVAEQQYGQWVYVRRSVRVFSGRKIYICKPTRRLEWTETQALLDAADIIADVADERRREL